MAKTIARLISTLSEDPSLQEAVERVYNVVKKLNKPLFESQISVEVGGDRMLRNNMAHHGPYLRTALDILVSEDLLEKKGAKYSLR